MRASCPCHAKAESIDSLELSELGGVLLFYSPRVSGAFRKGATFDRTLLGALGPAVL